MVEEARIADSATRDASSRAAYVALYAADPSHGEASISPMSDMAFN